MTPIQPVVTGRVLNDAADHRSAGRFWSLPSFCLYAIMWDPLVLDVTGRCPRLRQDGEPLAAANVPRLLTYADPTTVQDISAIQDAMASGDAVVFNHPELALLDRLALPLRVQTERPVLFSLRERWNLGPHAARNYYCPHGQAILRFFAPATNCITRIGGNPDLVVMDQIAAFASDPFETAAVYFNQPDLLSQLMVDLSNVFVEAVGRLTGNIPSPQAYSRLAPHFDLRRDFHSLGYACMTVCELAYCHGQENIDLGDVERTAVEAAHYLVQGDASTASALLGQTFQTLEKINRRYQPVPAVFTDTLHGGELYPDIGYFEIDWPQHVADVLRTYLGWVHSRSYRFHVDFGATTVRELALRYPDLFEELRDAQAQGLVEFVNGSCNQPYALFHSLESQIRQFDVGSTVWRDVLGDRPRTYASQEFGFCPQIAAILVNHGYDQAVIRAQNMGDCSTINEEQIDWIAPSGDRLRALPSHPHKSEKLNTFTYNNLHMKLFQHFQQTPDFAVFTCLGDITYYRFMREELARVCHYAPVFGRFETFGEYFGRTRDKTVAAHQLKMEEFHCDAGFFNLELWGQYQDYTGNFVTNCTRSWKATELFAAAEALDAYTGGCSAADHGQNWEALTHYQGHGNYLVYGYISGAFQGPYDNDRTRQAQRGIQNVTEYLGPLDLRQIGPLCDDVLTKAETRASEHLRAALARLTCEDGAGEFIVFNFAPRRRRIVHIEGLAGRDLMCDGRSVRTQADGLDLLAEVDLAEYGLTVLEEDQLSVRDGQTNNPGVTVTTDALANDYLQVRFDLKTGAICEMLRRSDGLVLFNEPTHLFVCPGAVGQRCRRSHIVHQGPLRGTIEFDIEVTCEGAPAVEVIVRATLDSHSQVLDLETRVVTPPPLSGDQWTNHLGVRFMLAGENPQLRTAHFNVLEPHGGQKLTSPNVLVADDLVFLNEGAEFYRRDDRSLTQILIVENEPARRFRYAVGLAARNPLMQGRRWSGPLFMHHGKRAAELSPHLSLGGLEDDDIEILSIRSAGDIWQVRLANTSGQPTSLRLSVPGGKLHQAWTSSFSGCRGELLAFDGSAIPMTLRPWEIRQVQMCLSTDVPKRPFQSDAALIQKGV